MIPVPNTVPHGTPWGVDEAIGWLHAQAANKSTGWGDRCLGMTAQAFGYLGSGTVPDRTRNGGRAGRSGWAIEAWQQADPATKHAGIFSSVPRGGIIHWRGPNGGPGHTAISAGDGMIYTNDLVVKGQIRKAPIGQVARQWGFIMVGWREPGFRNGNGRNPARPAAIPDPWLAYLKAHTPSGGKGASAPVPPSAAKPQHGKTHVIHETTARQRPDLNAPFAGHSRQPGYVIRYRAVRVANGHTWLVTLLGNYYLAERTTRGE